MEKNKFKCYLCSTTASLFLVNETSSAFKSDVIIFLKFLPASTSCSKCVLILSVGLPKTFAYSQKKK